MHVVDADQIARDVVAPGEPAYDELVAAFGTEVLEPSGALNRKALGARAFADPAARATLNRITHPRIAAQSQARIAELSASGAPYVLYEAALLVENGIHRMLPALVVVAASEQTQLDRIMERDGLTRDEARARIDAQLPLVEKRAAASFVIENDGPIDATLARVREIDRALRERHAEAKP